MRCHFSAPGNEEMLKVIYPVTVTGVLKGFDQLLNLVLDDVQEIFQTGPFSVHLLTLKTPCPDHVPFLCIRTESEQTTRNLGLVVLRGPTITLLSPVDGHEEIANPFLAQE